MCTCVHVRVYRCMCICMYMYICMPMYMHAYTFIYVCALVYICTRVGAFCYDDDCFYYHSWRNNVVIAFGTLSSFLYYPMSLLHARVSQVFLNTCMRVCGGIGSGVCLNLVHG